jgi:hypothetical protein
MGILVVAQASTSINFAVFVTRVLHDELVSRSAEVSVIPPQDTSISGAGEELVTSSGTSEPLDIVDGVVMRLLKDGGQLRLASTIGVSFS